MKKYYFLILVMTILNPILVFAESNCKADVYSAVFRADGRLFRTFPANDGKNLTVAKDWKDCYEFAIRTSKSYRSEISVTLNLEKKDKSGEVVLSENVDTTAYTFIKWEYNGWLNSSGEITAHTNKFSTTPQKGSMKYFVDGNMWQ